MPDKSRASNRMTLIHGARKSSLPQLDYSDRKALADSKSQPNLSAKPEGRVASLPALSDNKRDQVIKFLHN